MRFKTTSLLVAIAFAGLWLGALLSRSTVFIEMASLVSIGVIFIALPLAIFDNNKYRRAFWAGFFSVGFGTFFVFSVGSWMDGTSDTLSSTIARLPRFQESADRQPVSTVVQASFYDANGQIQMLPSSMPAPAIAFQTDVRNSLPFLISFLLGVLGGAITSFASISPKLDIQSEDAG